MTRLLDWVRGRHGLPLRGDASGRFLVWTAAVMSFLAALALGAVLAVGSMVDRWDRSIAGSATVLILADGDLPPAELQARQSRAVAALRAVPGVEEATPLSAADAARLIEPWIGAAETGDLPVPAVITLRYAPGAASVEAMKAALRDIPGASFDDHLQWLDGLRRLARTGTLAGLTVLALVGLVATLSVMFATGSALSIQRDVLEVLHIIGARDGYIATGFARRTTSLALQGAVLGTIAGAMLLGLAQLYLSGIAGGGGMVSGLGLGGLDWVTLALLPIPIAVLAGATAYLTARRTLLSMP